MGSHIAIYIPIFVGMFISLLFAILLPFMMSGNAWKAAQDKARERRMTDHKINARLLTLNL